MGSNIYRSYVKNYLGKEFCKKFNLHWSWQQGAGNPIYCVKYGEKVRVYIFKFRNAQDRRIETHSEYTELILTPEQCREGFTPPQKAMHATLAHEAVRKAEQLNSLFRKTRA